MERKERPPKIKNSQTEAEISGEDAVIIEPLLPEPRGKVSAKDEVLEANSETVLRFVQHAYPERGRATTTFIRNQLLMAGSIAGDPDKELDRAITHLLETGQLVEERGFLVSK